MMLKLLRRQQQTNAPASEFGAVGASVRSYGFSMGKTEIVSTPPPPPPPPSPQQIQKDRDQEEARRHYDSTMNEMGFRKPSHNIPHYTNPIRAAADYVSGAIFYAKQTLLSLPTDLENQGAKERFIKEGGNIEKFIPPYKDGKPIYSGYPPPQGVEGLMRSWNFARSNESGRWLYNPAETNTDSLGKLAVPNPPDMVSYATINGWLDSPTGKHRMQLSMAVGGGEQIEANPSNINFSNPRPIRR